MLPESRQVSHFENFGKTVNLSRFNVFKKGVTGGKGVSRKKKEVPYREFLWHLSKTMPL